MSLVLALASSPVARAGNAWPSDAWAVKGSAPTLIKSSEPLVVQYTGLKVTMSPSHDDGKGGPVPNDLPFGPNVRVWDDPAQETNPSIVKDSVTGYVFVAFQHFNGADWDIYMGMSADDGATWAVAPMANTAANEINPSLAVTSNGAFALSYQQDTENLRMYIFQSVDGLAWSQLYLDFLPTSPFSNPAFPNVVTQQSPVGNYPGGVMFAWQAFCSDATNCGGGATTIYWYGSSDWTLATPSIDLGGSYWLVDPVRVDRFGLVDVTHPSAGWSSIGYFMAVDDEGYTAAERRATWLVLDEPAQSATNEWIQNWWSQDAQGCYPVMGASGSNVIVITTIKNATAAPGNPTNHNALFFSSSDGWGNVLNADWLDPAATDQRAFGITGFEAAGTTTFRLTYYSNSVVSSMDTTDVAMTWNGPLKVSDNAGTGVNDYRATSIWTDSSGAPKVAWQDNRDGNVNIYTTGYLTYPFWVNSTCGGAPSNMRVLVDGGPYPQTPITGQWTAGTTHTLQITQVNQQESFCKRCTFVRWSDGTTNTLKTITSVNAPFSITAIFDDAYRVQLDTTPVPLQLSWKGTTQNTPIVAFERPGTYTANAPSPQAGMVPTERYVFVDWSDGITTPTRNAVVGTACLNMTANFGFEYEITLQTVPPGLLVGYDTAPLANAPVTFWSAPGIQHMVITTSPQPPSPIDTRYRFDRWAGGPNTWGWNITVSGANTYTANFVTQYLIQIRANIENPGPTVGSDIQFNTPPCDVQSPAPLRCWADINSSPNLILLSPQSTAGSRYVFLQWSDGNLQTFRPIGPIIAPATYMSMWSAEYMLTMTMDSSCQGSVSPSSGWYTKGANVNIDWTAPTGLPPGERYLFLRWEGSGVGSYTGTIQSTSVTMNDAITQTAFCRHQFQVTLNTSPIPLDYVVGGAGGDIGVNGQMVYWWEYMSVHWFNVTTTTQGGATTRYVFVDWSDGNPNPNHPAYTVGASQSFTARFKTQFKVTLGQVPAAPAGIAGLACSNPDCWFDDGSSAMVSVASQTWPTGAQWYRYAFDRWTGDASGTATSYTFPSISQPRTATANWVLWYKITVTSPQGSPVCSNADCWYQSGSTATVTVTSPFPTGATTTRYLITGWTGDPGTGTTTFTIAMDASKNVTATWKTQHKLTVISQCGSTECGTPTQTAVDGWYDADATATVTVTSPADVGGTKFNFDGWAGDATGTTTTATVLMNAPKTATANWKEEPKQPAADYMVWIILIIIVIVVVLVLILLMKRKKSPVEEELPPEEIPPAPPAKSPPPAKPMSPSPKPAAPPPAGGPKPQAPPPAKK